MSHLKKRSILVVDDNLQNLQYLGNILEENGFEPTLTRGGHQALEFLEDETPDLILLDIMMPEMDGYEVCKIIKEDVAVKDIPVIFITAKTETDDIVKGFDAGGVDYITKPFNSAELLARVKTHIEVKILRGMLPICSSCKKIRDDEGYWKHVEAYIQSHAQVTFSHGICPDCMRALYGDQPWFEKMEREEESPGSRGEG
ncbi:MAG: response regulator [Desulfobacterales bacterium]|nr:response regulator [Desulfobacterales bacterium]